MRLVVAILVAAVVCWPAFAKGKATKKSAPARKFTGKLLTYSQLMSLNKQKRMAYIKGLTEVLILMEGFNGKYVTAGNYQGMREQIAGFLQVVRLFPEANAAEVPGGGECADVSAIVPVYDSANNQWGCSKPECATFEYNFGVCMMKNYDSYSTVYPEKSCPAGTKQIPHAVPGKVGCIPDANWKAIPDLIRAKHQARETLPAIQIFRPSELRNKRPEQQALSVGLSPASNPQPLGVTEEPVDATDPAVKQPADGVPHAGPQEELSPQACVPPVQACKQLSDADRETAITRFRGTAKYDGVDANVCIAGGFMRKYKTTKKLAGKCEIPLQITLNNGAKVPSPGCDARSEALCNPVLFCLGAKPNGSDKFEPITFCVKKTGNTKNYQITQSCASDYANMLRGIHQKDKKGNDLPLVKGAPGIKPEQCDPKDMPNELPIKAEWDELIANVEKLRDVWCGKSDFAALFCTECEIISDKIYKMNKDATGTGCSDQVIAGTTAVEDSAPAPGRAIKESPNRLDDK